MNLNRNKLAFLILRLGLAATLLYAAINILIDPASWFGFVPIWLVNILTSFNFSIELFLISHAIIEAGLGLWLLTGWQVRWASLIIFLDMLSILVFHGIDLVTFRDVGLLGVALFLALYSNNLKIQAPL